MRFLRTLSLTVLWVAALAASAVGLLVTWPSRVPLYEAFHPLGQNAMTALADFFTELSVPDWLFLFWLLVLGLCVLVALATLSIAFSGRGQLRIERVVDGGTVLMSPQATKNYIATALAPFSDLACRRIDLAQGRRGLETTVHAQLRTQDDVASLERQLIERVHSALTNDLGIQNVSKVKVVIKEFGLPKGIQPKPVPAVAISESHSPQTVEAAPGPAVTGIYPAPAESAQPAVNEKGNLVLSQPAGESATGEAAETKGDGEEKTKRTDP